MLTVYVLLCSLKGVCSQVLTERGSELNTVLVAGAAVREEHY